MRVSSYGWGCGWGCGLRCVFGQNLVERGDGGIDVLALQDVRRQEAQHRVAGAVDEDVALEHLGHGELGEVGRIEFGGQHQALAAHIDDGIVAAREPAQLRLEVVADLDCVARAGLPFRWRR